MRVLLVEDDPMIGSAVQAALKDASYAADWVKDGSAALTALAAQHYDLVLLDLGLPGRDGLDVLRTLRSRESASASDSLINIAQFILQAQLIDRIGIW